MSRALTIARAATVLTAVAALAGVGIAHAALWLLFTIYAASQGMP